MKRFPFLIVVFLVIVESTSAMESIYTDLTEQACPVVDRAAEGEGDWTRQICSGVGGYKLAILGDDARISVNVISPDGKEYPLNLWEVVSNRFSNHGNKAEWRVVKKAGNSIPEALIIRVNVYEFPEKPDKFTSYLSVSKIAGDRVCVTDKIKPGPKQNEKARLAADTAVQKPCLEPASN